ncbi:MAG: hypothetical protein J3K34DRAFT_519969 [Monoraphidium minutum]|nr:MAG: hypothetical protein J3K34DRAFT_519969 [Monoraphidium minutum]
MLLAWPQGPGRRARWGGRRPDHGMPARARTPRCFGRAEKGNARHIQKDTPKTALLQARSQSSCELPQRRRRRSWTCPQCIQSSSAMAPPLRGAQAPPPAADLYELLGLDRGCGTVDVRRAYRRAARAAHPDKGGSASAFAALTAAFETLSDPPRRTVYDAHHAAAACHGRGGWGGGGGGGGGGWGGGAWRGAGAADGDDYFEVPGAEAALLRELAARAGAGPLDAGCQLVVVCELCGRPATQECWTCGMAICSLCGRRRHFKGGAPLHWPLVDAPGRMLELLGRQELERKRLEDGRALLLALPGHRSDAESRVLREFEALWAAAHARAAGGAAASRGGAVAYGSGGGVGVGAGGGGGALSRHYLWAQTDACIHIAVYDPLAEPGRESVIEASHEGLRVGATSAPPTSERGAPPAAGGAAASKATGPVLDRRWAHAVDAAAGVLSWRGGEGGRLATLRVAKARPGQAWHSLFRGDSLGARCVPPPYALSSSASEAALDLPLPRWVVPSEDVAVQITGRDLRVAVDGAPGGALLRTFWRPEGGAEPLVAQELCGWSVAAAGGAPRGSSTGAAGAGAGAGVGAQPGAGAGAQPGGRGGAPKVLSVVLAFRELRPPAPGKADPGDHRAAPREGAVLAGAGRKGWALFEEDEDRFGLTPLLQASTFDECGRAWVAPAPWEPAGAGGGGGGGFWAASEGQLPREARAALQSLRAAAAAAEGGNGGFETPDPSQPEKYPKAPYNTYNKGWGWYVAIPGWSWNCLRVDWMPKVLELQRKAVATAPEGMQNLEMLPNATGVACQTVNVAPGATYRLSFYYGRLETGRQPGLTRGRRGQFIKFETTLDALYRDGSTKAPLEKGVKTKPYPQDSQARGAGGGGFSKILTADTRTHAKQWQKYEGTFKAPASGKVQLAFTTTMRPKECGSCGSLLDAVCLQKV